ncbi:hypothetical protein BD770DRAFT_409691 [Pilaira anomala]|nr:hypothetical protein BD770DRAFT_409691 [Pilaira anomala]
MVMLLRTQRIFLVSFVKKSLLVCWILDLSYGVNQDFSILLKTIKRQQGFSKYWGTVALKESCVDRYIFIDYSTILIPMSKTDEELKIYRIYGHLLKFFAFRKKPMIRWRRMSEEDIFKNFWCSIMDILFEGSRLFLISGGTWSSGSKCVSFDEEQRGPYKVELRLVLETSSPVSPMKICYLKNEHGYVSQTIRKTIMFPTTPNHISKSFEISLPHLYYWKERAEKNMDIIQNGFDEDRSSFGVVTLTPCNQKIY